MDFKQYYAKKINEEGNFLRQPIDTDAPVQHQQPVQNNQAPTGSLIQNYISQNSNLKVSLSKLGKDLGDQIFKYATEELVKEEDFDSAEKQNEYMNSIRDKINEGYNLKLIEILKNIGIYIENQKNLIAK